jgi:molybdopterin-guanine dinucleotide biosynthesis protein A
MRPLIALLTGGRSSRMGTDKAQVTIEGETLLERVAGVAGSVGDVVLVGGPPAEGLERIPDLRSGRLGPLAGLEAALVHGAGRDVILVGVDQPFVRADTLRRLSEIAGDAVVPIDNRWEQVTCAVYRDRCLPAIQEALDTAEDLAIITILANVGTTRVERHEWTAWGEDGRSWYSVDTPEALAAGIARYEPTPG